MRLNALLGISILMLCLAPSALGQRTELKLGDPAPGLDIETWINGQETSIENGYTYIVLFFSTEDTAIDRIVIALNKVYENNRSEGLLVLGITDDDEDVARPYVQRKGELMTFTVGIDRRSSTNRSWIGASGIEKTPAVFLIDKRGLIQYMGDPLSPEFPDVLKLVVEQRYDAKLYEQAKPALQAIKTARRMRNWRMCLKYIDDLIDTDQYAFAPKVLEKFEVLLVDMNEPDRAYEYAREMMTKYADDPELLIWFAEKIVDDPVIPREKRDLDVALEMIKTAAPQIDPNDPDRYAAEAKVHFHRGEYMEAVQQQRKAYLISPPKRKPAFERVLRSYMEAARQERAAGP